MAFRKSMFGAVVVFTIVALEGKINIEAADLALQTLASHK